MKKNAAKSTAAKTPAPATKAEPVKKTAAKKPAAPVKKVAAPESAKATKPVAVKPAAKPAKAPAPKAKSLPVTTTIVAAIDVGFGNSLSLRGEGPGLSWDSGLPMECVGDDRWSISLPEGSQPILCKFLINDTTWCAGEDYTVLPGSSVVLSPVF